MELTLKTTWISSLFFEDGEEGKCVCRYFKRDDSKMGVAIIFREDFDRVFKYKKVLGRVLFWGLTISVYTLDFSQIIPPRRVHRCLSNLAGPPAFITPALRALARQASTTPASVWVCIIFLCLASQSLSNFVDQEKRKLFCFSYW